jgi:hypothetical protein
VFLLGFLIALLLAGGLFFAAPTSRVVRVHGLVRSKAKKWADKIEDEESKTP